MEGSQLARLAQVMDQLRSPGGCPWDAEQTHESLLKYLLEESYEFVDAVHSGNRIDMREVLGDQALDTFHHHGHRQAGGATQADHGTARMPGFQFVQCHAHEGAARGAHGMA